MGTPLNRKKIEQKWIGERDDKTENTLSQKPRGEPLRKK